MTPFDEMYIKCTNAADQLPNSGSLYPQKNHVDIIRDYTTSEHVRNVVDLVVKHCTKPTFIPVLDSVVFDTEPDTGSDKIHITSFILCHAVQILLFAPTEWNKDLVYSRHSADYIHRYPSPAVHEGQDMAAVGGFFSLEDLNRAVVLFQYALNRRSRSTTSILANRRPAHVTGQFKGYASPEFASCRTTSGGDAANVGITNAMHFFAMNADASMDNSEASGSLTGMDAIDVHADAWDLVASGKANQKMRLHGSKSYPPLDIRTFKKILEGAEKKFGWNDIDEDFIRSTKHRTSFSRFLERSDKQAISQMMSQADGDSIPVQLEVAALNRIMNARQPAREVDYAHICELMQICPETLSLYPGKFRIQPLMAHQVSDLYELIQRIFNIGHVILANDMGVGKTKEFLALIEADTRLRMRKRELLSQQKQCAPEPFPFQDELNDIPIQTEEDGNIWFRPTLIVNPVNTIHQTYHEAIHNFPSFNIKIYYGSSNNFPDGKSNVQDKASLLSMLEALMEAKDDEKTGRTVILTSYQTLNTREVQKMESHFFFRKQIPTTSAAPNDHSSSVTADISQLGAASASGKRKPVGPSTPQKRRKLTKTTYEYVDFRFETDEEVLERISSRQKGEDVTETANDSCLVTFLRGEDLQDFQIYKFPKGTHSGADGNLVEYQLQRPAFDQVEFQFLVVDEAHMAKSANKAWNQTFRLFNWKHLVWVTGTPLSSSLADLTSPLTLMWTAYGLNISKLYNMEFGNLGGIYDLDYDPYLDENHLPGGVTYGILSESLSRQRVGDGWEQIIEIYKTKGFHIWLLNPVFYNIMGEASKWSSDFGKNVTARILNIVCMRRTLYSLIRLPSGELSCPASILPPMTIITEEVCFGPEDREQVRKHGILMARGLSMQEGDKLENVTPTNPSVATVRKEHRVNFAAWRAGILVAHDIRDATLLMGTDEYGEDKDIVHEAFQAIRTAGDLSEANANRLQKKKKVKIGVEKVLYLREHDINGGLDYFYAQCNVNPAFPTLVTAGQWIHWLCRSSPVTTRVLQLCIRYVFEQRERFVVFCDMPWIQQKLYATLRLAGFTVNTIHPEDTSATKASQLSNFNNRHSNAQIFLANINTMATGVNLHHCCSYGAVLGFQHNARTICQSHGRLHRLAQKKKVVWHNIKVKNSFHDHQERSMLMKWVKQLSAEVDLPASLSCCLRDIVIFEMLKTHWGHSFNRYAWIILFDVDGVALDYYAPDTVQLGHAISYVAKQTLFRIHLESHDDDYMANLETEVIKNLIFTIKAKANTVEDWEKLLEKLENDLLDGRDQQQLSQDFTNLVKTASIPKEGSDGHNDDTASEQEDRAEGEQGDKAYVGEAVVDKRGLLSTELLTASDLESDVPSEDTASEQEDRTEGEQGDKAYANEAVVDKRGLLSSEFLTASDLESDVPSEEEENSVEERENDEKPSGQKSRQERNKEKKREKKREKKKKREKNRERRRRKRREERQRKRETAEEKRNGRGKMNGRAPKFAAKIKKQAKKKMAMRRFESTRRYWALK